MTDRIRVTGTRIPVGSDPDANADWIVRGIEIAAGEGADILLTPEGAVSGYGQPGNPAEVGIALNRIRDAGRAAGIALAIGVCLEGRGGDLENQLRLYDRNGELAGVHSKVLLCSSGPNFSAELEEATVFAAGRSTRVVELDGVRIGALICNDLWANPLYTYGGDPQLAVALASSGAQLILHAVNTGFGPGADDLEDDTVLERAFHEANLRLRARAAGIPIVSVDCADPSAEQPTNSISGAVDGSGRWIQRAGDAGPEFFTAELAING